MDKILLSTAQLKVLDWFRDDKILNVHKVPQCSLNQLSTLSRLGLVKRLGVKATQEDLTSITSIPVDEFQITQSGKDTLKVWT